MMVISAFLVFSAAPVVMEFPRLQCCMKELPNGSVSYTLNHTGPQNWFWTWIKNEVVIVSEHGDTSEDVLCPTQNGYILKEQFTGVVCKVESPADGVSMEVPCTDWCDATLPTDPGGTDSQSQLGLYIGLSVLCAFCLFAFVFLVYRCQSNRCRDNPTSVNMQPVAVVVLDGDPDQNQGFLENRNNPDHQNTPE
ncbi:uncharacterized protein Hap1MRO34_005453 [Clarias gariepinus]